MTSRSRFGQTAGGTAALRSPRRRGGGVQSRSINLFYVPTLLVLIVFTVYPLVSGIQLSLTSWDGYSPEKAFTGVDNYVRMLTDSTFHLVLLNTLVYGVGSTLIQQVLGLGLAVLLDRPVRGRAVLRAIIYLPVLVSPVIMGTMYYFLFQYNNGALNTVGAVFGVEKTAWFDDAGIAVAIIVIVNSAQFVGISMIIYLAGLQSIPEDIKQAASLDGASGWAHFRHITLPLLQPAFATSIVLNLIGGLKLFDMIKVLTGGGPGYATNSVSTYISVAYFNNQAAGYASAMGVVLFVLILTLTLALNAGLNRNKLEL
ncbi:sugar ABC transporter permease [Cryobacterium sp. TMT2-15-1]|uniref:carbohydrate ABC transporter permease n=1 Tax=Cryobacterium sp. TMT2-15-1 TaxID=1259246 RepID=UPI00106BEE91|nr:sugar ABC transporter permease [Cryobacterium sp. TMT2-15-1]TFC55794.1 sugar ABC transporter permease [Cryobacterium sp. TMT2-15-1]